VERHLLRRREEKAIHLALVVLVPFDQVGVLAERLAQEVASHPVEFFPHDLMVEILKKVELNRLAGPIGGLHAIDHHPTNAANEASVEKANRAAQLPIELFLPEMPLVGIDVAACDPPPAI